MEEGLNAILIRSKHRHPKNLIKYFPLNKGDIFKDQLLIISNKIKSYGNGYLQSKEFVYYYKTFTYQESNIKLFCVIYYHFSLNRNYIIKLAEEIYKLTDTKNLFKNNDIDENITLEINEVFFKYISLIRKEKGIFEFCSGIECISFKHEDDICDLDSTHGVNQGTKKNYYKIKEKNNITNSELGNTFNNIPFTETELNCLMKGYNLYKAIQINKWKKFKKIWLIIFIISSILIYIFLGFYIYIFFK